MSFNLNVDSILQYGYNVFASAQNLIYIFIGITLGLMLLRGLISIFKV